MAPKNFHDEEIIEMINENLKEDGRVRTSFLDVDCMDGKPILSGRVASDEELQVIDEIMNDVLDIHDYENNVWVDDSLAFEDSEEEDDVQELNLDEDGDADEEEDDYGDEDDDE